MPVNADVQALLTEWNKLAEELAAVKNFYAAKTARELELRRTLVSLVWPDPKEGVNNEELEGGWTLKGTYKLERKVDEAALPAVLIELQKRLINTDALIKNVPELKLRFYRELSPADKLIMNQALQVKPCSPVLELIPPKK